VAVGDQLVQRVAHGSARAAQVGADLGRAEVVVRVLSEVGPVRRTWSLLRCAWLPSFAKTQDVGREDSSADPC
jgi:hypothetical protein